VRLAKAFACTCWLAFAADSRGAPGDLDLIADFPPGGGPFPAGVLAPGEGYHMRLPAMERTAEALVAQGHAVYRFNWAYWSREPKGKPAADLSSELDDIRRVLAAARSDRRVAADSSRSAASR